MKKRFRSVFPLRAKIKVTREPTEKESDCNENGVPDSARRS